MRKAMLRVLAVCVISAWGCTSAKETSEVSAPQVANTSKLAKEEPQKKEEKPLPKEVSEPETYPNVLLVSISEFETQNGKSTAKPKQARLEILQKKNGTWKTHVVTDASSNVFHKALMLPRDAQGKLRLLTLGGMKASLKEWMHKKGELSSEVVWTKEFGGKFNRMRDAEVGDVDGDGKPDIAVGTHDQGVVAILSETKQGWSVKEIDRQKNTFIHEIEIGDLNANGKKEIYATPSEPNKLSGGEQHGEVVRYEAPKWKREKVVDLGNRHAKEIYVGDVDGDGKDELYVAVEAHATQEGGQVKLKEPVEIRRYEEGQLKGKDVVIARLQDRFCRFLTAGDVDGDGKKELVAAAFRSGLWLLRPGNDPNSEWSKESIDKRSSGFEHASLLTDLDGDGVDELYVASDDQRQIRQYKWKRGRVKMKVLHSWTIPFSRMTWNLMPAPAEIAQFD